MVDARRSGDGPRDAHVRRLGETRLLRERDRAHIGRDAGRARRREDEARVPPTRERRGRRPARPVRERRHRRREPSCALGDRIRESLPSREGIEQERAPALVDVVATTSDDVARARSERLHPLPQRQRARRDLRQEHAGRDERPDPPAGDVEEEARVVRDERRGAGARRVDGVLPERVRHDAERRCRAVGDEHREPAVELRLPRGWRRQVGGGVEHAAAIRSAVRCDADRPTGERREPPVAHHDMPRATDRVGRVDDRAEGDTADTSERRLLVAEVAGGAREPLERTDDVRQAGVRRVVSDRSEKQEHAPNVAASREIGWARADCACDPPAVAGTSLHRHRG